MKRRAKAFVAAGLVIAAAIAVLGVWQRHELAEHIALQAAAWAGLPQLRLKVAEWNSGRAVLTGVKAGPRGRPDLVIDRLVLTFDTASLRRQRAKQVEATGVRLAARWGQDGISVGVLDTLLFGGGDRTAGTALPFDSLTLNDGEIVLEALWGQTRIPISGSLGNDESGAALRGRMTAGLDLVHGIEPLGLTGRGDLVVDVSMDGRLAKAPAWTLVAVANIAALAVHGQAVAPLQLSGKATLARGIVHVSAEATDAGGLWDLRADGRHDLAGNNGEVAFRVPPTTFSPERQPQSLLPWLRGKVASVAGTLELTGKAAWRASELTSGLTLTYAGGALSTQLAEASGIEARITFDSLWPPATAPGQTVRVAKLDAGIQLADVSASFQILSEGAVLIERAGWPWAGGVIEARDVRLTPGAERHSLTLNVRGVDLTHLLNLVDLEGLQGNGRLDGSIPIEVIGSTPYIRNGRLATGPGGGIISYASESTDAALRGGGTGGELLADALKNFHYTEIAMELDGETTGPVNLRLRVAGANPTLYDGHPIELNVNVEGDLGQMLRAGTAGSGFADGLLRHIEGRRLGESK